MSKTHKSRPEPVLFLLEAMDAMREYHKLHKKYPTEWKSLKIDFSAGPFRVGDFGTHPTPETGDRWCPKGCTFTYWIKVATNDSFVIQAINQNNVAEYEITEQQDSPVHLLKS